MQNEWMEEFKISLPRVEETIKEVYTDYEVQQLGIPTATPHNAALTGSSLHMTLGSNSSTFIRLSSISADLVLAVR